MNGTSLMPLVRGETLAREHLFIQFDGNGARGNFQRCILSGRYKLIVDMFKDETYLELYDVEQDGQEQCNLAFDAGYSDLVVRLLGRLRSHMTETGDLLELKEPETVYRRFLEDYVPFRKSKGAGANE
jgi:hypothetical protein